MLIPLDLLFHGQKRKHLQLPRVFRLDKNLVGHLLSPTGSHLKIPFVRPEQSMKRAFEFQSELQNL